MENTRNSTFISTKSYLDRFGHLLTAYGIVAYVAALFLYILPFVGVLTYIILFLIFLAFILILLIFTIGVGLILYKDTISQMWNNLSRVEELMEKFSYLSTVVSPIVSGASMGLLLAGFLLHIFSCKNKSSGRITVSIVFFAFALINLLLSLLLPLGVSVS